MVVDVGIMEFFPQKASFSLMKILPPPPMKNLCTDVHGSNPYSTFDTSLNPSCCYQICVFAPKLNFGAQNCST
jgi:hypothetical protein